MIYLSELSRKKSLPRTIAAMIAMIKAAIIAAGKPDGGDIAGNVRGYFILVGR